MERICKNCKFFVVTGVSFNKKNKQSHEIGVCQRPGGKAKKIRGRLIGGEPMYDDESCKSFRKSKNKNAEPRKKTKNKK